MTLSEIKNVLSTVEEVDFLLPDGTMVPRHFHVTEVGMINKHFIDCGGTIRDEQAVSFQLWNANDFDHRLKPTKLLNIIKLSEEKLGIRDAPIEVEYQNGTIGKFGLDFDGSHFLLTNKFTTCLASDQCGIPEEALQPAFAIQTSTSCCAGSGCC